MRIFWIIGQSFSVRKTELQKVGIEIVIKCDDMSQQDLSW